ncbi:ABC transporter permease [Solidesulfovibrio carbinolicus]|uniref:ABC-2 type transporter transmembrane domain-containing protein n=1 Tax=Solidesulfovibrio carbinolicus TaxID=296842 RepID=A0A4P6HQI5_9BACT|nr:ABC transporter permease [Solidesulfovibrio carbinolicus]QAZ69583.1 hypothetical protein C3Y92_20045 [Solidesulfovibrio carbinolicus]
MFNDLFLGFLRWPMWTSLAWEDICQKYRRNIIGPFWISLSNALTVAAMALIFSQIFNQKIDTFVPYLAAGMTMWTFIGSIITESTNVFVNARPIMFSIKLPISLHVFRLLFKNVISLIHLLVVYILVAIYFSTNFNSYTWFIVPSFLVVMANGIWFGILFGMICARYRDLAQIVSMLFGISMYLTPIFWTVESLGKYQPYLLLNPLYCMLAILRDPLLGQPPNIPAYFISITIACAGFYIAGKFFNKNRNSLIFWL